MAHGSIDDLATLCELDENNLMEELQARYKKDIIYVINHIFAHISILYQLLCCTEYTSKTKYMFSHRSRLHLLIILVLF